MAVTSGMTSAEDFEGGPTFVSIGGGAGASANTDIFIQAAQSGGRREDNVADHGFWADTGAGIDLSAAGTHVKYWLWHTHYGVTTDFRFRMGTASATNYEYYPWSATNYPTTGGWVPVWVEVGHSSGVATGTLTTSNVRYFGLTADTPNIGGNAQNMILDEVQYGDGTLTWVGAGGSIADFRSYEATNVEGVLLSANGVDTCYARLALGDGAAAYAFTDSNFTLVWPDQPVISTTFMGLGVDLSRNVADSVTLSSFTMGSGDPAGATNRPDFLCVGTVSSMDMDSGTLQGFRIIDLTSTCSITNSTISNSGRVDAASAGATGADLSGTSVSSYTGASATAAVVWDVNADPNGELDDMTFVHPAAGTTHALELGITSPLTVTLTGHTYSGYNAVDGNNDSTIFVARTTGTVTINIAGGGDTPSIRTAGATVVVQNSVVVSIPVRDSVTSAVIEGAFVYLQADTGGPLPFEASVSITRSGAVATVTHTAHGFATDDRVKISGADQSEYNGAHQITVTGVNTYTYSVAGTPTTPATGTIVATAIILFGTTGALGIVEDTEFNFTSSQPVTGVVRKGTSSPVYRTAQLAGTIVSSTGFSTTAFLVSDA